MCNRCGKQQAVPWWKPSVDSNLCAVCCRQIAEYPYPAFWKEEDQAEMDEMVFRAKIEDPGAVDLADLLARTAELKQLGRKPLSILVKKSNGVLSLSRHNSLSSGRVAILELPVTKILNVEIRKGDVEDLLQTVGLKSLKSGIVLALILAFLTFWPIKDLVSQDFSMFILFIFPMLLICIGGFLLFGYLPAAKAIREQVLWFLDVKLENNKVLSLLVTEHQLQKARSIVSKVGFVLQNPEK
jgi:flagellar biosynthesis protein FliQ